MHSGGGNSTKASSGISCSETHYQKEKSIEDTNKAYIDDLMKYLLIKIDLDKENLMIKLLKKLQINQVLQLIS